MAVMLDTHIAVALYQGKTGGLSRAALRAVDQEPLSYSPAVLLELELLHEIGRLRLGATAIARHLAENLDIHCAAERFVEVAKAALPLAFTRDPFDRLIVAHAGLIGADLITLDDTIRVHYAKVL